MVYLSKIYTRFGDAGQTMLGDGTQVPKTHPRIIAYGGVDELNSLMGWAISVGLPAPTDTWMARIQNDLFDLGADLCVPESSLPAETPTLRVTAAQVEQLEHWIDEINEPLAPLKSFILPGGTPAAAALHMARAACRRVEIGVLQLAALEPVNPQAKIYLNRLSDLLFVLARHINHLAQGDVLWVPGQNR